MGAFCIQYREMFVVDAHFTHMGLTSRRKMLIRVNKQGVRSLVCCIFCILPQCVAVSCDFVEQLSARGGILLPMWTIFTRFLSKIRPICTFLWKIYGKFTYILQFFLQKIAQCSKFFSIAVDIIGIL